MRYFIVCVLLFALNNLAIAPLMESISFSYLFLIFLCFGAIGAQASLHAVWCVFAPAGRAKRLAAVVAALVLFGTWFVGFGISSDREFLRDDWIGNTVAALLCLPLVAIACQSPLWLAKVWLGWRVLPSSTSPKDQGDRRIGIWDMLVATGCVAIAFSIAQLAAMAVDTPPATFLASFASFALTLAGINLFTTLPMVMAALRARRWWVAILAVMSVNVAAAVGLYELRFAFSDARPGPWSVYFELMCMIGSYFAWLTGVLLVARKLGYRLEWGKNRPGKPTEEVPEAVED